MPLENLSGTGSLDWIGSASASLLVSGLTTAPELYPVRPETMADARLMHADRVLQGYFVMSRGQLEIRATLEDQAARKTIHILSEQGPVNAGPAPLIDALARSLTSQARVVSPSNPEALKFYGQALIAGTLPEQLHNLQASVHADPAFAPAYSTWVQVLLSHGQNQDAQRVAQTSVGLVRDPVGAAELRVLRSVAAGDTGAQTASLQALSRLTPTNPDLYRALATTQFANHRFADAIPNFQTVVRLQPWNADAFNLLGYAQAFHQDLDGARQSLLAYGRLLPPGDTNALDSLGEVNFFLGDFQSAERYFIEAQRENPNAGGGEDLLKAAQTRLLAGDTTGADKAFGQYAAARASDPFLPLQRARWHFLTGRRKQAIEELQGLLPKLAGDQASFAESQLSFWKLETDDRPVAAKLAENAAHTAQSSAARNLSAMCQLLAMPPAPVGEWTTRAAKIFPQPDQASLRNTALAYALTISHDFSDAIPLLTDVLTKTNPSEDGQVRTLLAWASRETKRTADAARYLAICPLPLKSGDPVFASLVFPRWLKLKADALEQAGRGPEAQHARQTYQQYAGDLPDVLGL